MTASLPLAAESCTACLPDSPSVSQTERERLLQTLPGWSLVVVDKVPQLTKSYAFSNFRKALAFANLVGQLAEAENHHPELVVTWGKVCVSWWTHSIQGLHRNDFILAARCEGIQD